MTPRETFRAHMANNGGQWHAYVVLLNVSVLTWPEHDWNRVAPTPTLAERKRALSAMGYAVAPGAEWEWTESSDALDDPASPVLLIATVTVQSMGEVAA